MSVRSVRPSRVASHQGLRQLSLRGPEHEAVYILDGGLELWKIQFVGTFGRQEEECDSHHRLACRGCDGEGVRSALKSVPFGAAREGFWVARRRGLVVDHDQTVGGAIEEVDVALQQAASDWRAGVDLSPVGASGRLDDGCRLEGMMDQQPHFVGSVGDGLGLALRCGCVVGTRTSGEVDRLEDPSAAASGRSSSRGPIPATRSSALVRAVALAGVARSLRCRETTRWSQARVHAT